MTRSIGFSLTSLPDDSSTGALLSTVSTECSSLAPPDEIAPIKALKPRTAAPCLIASRCSLSSRASARASEAAARCAPAWAIAPRCASLSRAAETTEVGTGGAGGPRLGGGGGPPPRFAVGEGPGGPFLRGGGAFLRLPPLAAALMGGGGIRPGRPRPLCQPRTALTNPYSGSLGTLAPAFAAAHGTQK